MSLLPAAEEEEANKKSVKMTVSPPCSFLIDNILKPEFGSGDAKTTKSNSSQIPRFQKVEEGVSFNAKRSISCQNQNVNNRRFDHVSPSKSVDKDSVAVKKSDYPAWVYCTRYSDRPNSGNMYFQWHKNLPNCARLKMPSLDYLNGLV